MSFNIDFLQKKIIVTFNNPYEKGDIRNSFINITENINLKKIDHLIYDYSNIKSFSTPKEYIKILKLLTKFSTSWHNNLNILCIAKNIDLRNMITTIIGYNKNLDLKWNYMLFKNLEETLKWCAENE